MHRRAYWDGHGLFCEADYHERFPKSPTQTSGSFTCHKCWASQPVGKKYIERTSVNDLRVLRCQTCNNDTIIAARVHGQWATYTSIMARADRAGLCEVPFYANLDRVALELLQPGLAPTQRATIFWRRANDGRSEAAGFYAYQYPGDQFDERDDACEMDVPKLIALYVRPEFRGQGIGTELLRDFLLHQCVREAKHVAIEQISDEGLRLLARAVPADERKRFLEYRGDEFVRSLRLALERRDRVANYVKRLERQQRRAVRCGRQRSSRGRTPAAAAGLLLVAGCGSCEPIPEGPDVDGCRSSDTLPAAGPDDDDDPVGSPRGGRPRRRGGRGRAGEDLRRCVASFGTGRDVAAQKKLRTVELTVVAQTEHVANDVALISLFSPSPRSRCSSIHHRDVASPKVSPGRGGTGYTGTCSREVGA